MANALISIKPQYVEKIITGVKTAELRTRRLHLTPYSRLWIYSTSPASQIIGSVKVLEVVSDSVDSVWKLYGERIAISQQEFKEYLAQQANATVVLFDDLDLLDQPLSLAEARIELGEFSPPQFFKRVHESSELHGLLTAAAA